MCVCVCVCVFWGVYICIYICIYKPINLYHYIHLLLCAVGERRRGGLSVDRPRPRRHLARHGHCYLT